MELGLSYQNQLLFMFVATFGMKLLVKTTTARYTEVIKQIVELGPRWVRPDLVSWGFRWYKYVL